MNQKIEKLREVKNNLIAVLNDLELYIFTENIGKEIEKSVDVQKTGVVDELKQ
jgi:hypothetical protein